MANKNLYTDTPNLYMYIHIFISMYECIYIYVCKSVFVFMFGYIIQIFSLIALNGLKQCPK